MIKGTTEKGFEFEIDERNLDNWELLEVLADIDGGKESLMPKAIKMLLGDNQYKKLKDFLREDGIISIKAMAEEFSSIMEASQEVKN